MVSVVLAFLIILSSATDGTEVSQGVAPAAAPELWQGAQAGNSRAQILARFQGAASNPTPGNLASGARCEVHIPSYEVASRPYEVCFYLLSDRLTQVTLKSRSGARGHAANLEFEGVVELLRSRYGQESNYRDRSDSVMTMINADWNLSGRNVSAVLLYVGRNDDATSSVL